MVRGVQSKTLTLRGQAIHYYDLPGTGRGPPALLVHGLGGSANGFYRILFDLSRRFSRVLSPDLPGHGFSPLPPQGPLKLQDQLDVLVAFCEQVMRDRAFVVGNSLGGAMSLRLAHEQPHFVRALALVSPAGARISEERFREIARAMQVKTNAEARALTRRIFHRAPLSTILFSGALRPMYGTPAVCAAFAEAKPTDCVEPEVLGKLSVPVLLLWGASDRLLPPESVDYFRAHLPPSSQIHVVPRFGHVPQVERPNEVIRRLVRFADEIQL